MRAPLGLLAFLLAAPAVPAAPAGPAAASPRAELEGLESSIEAAVARVSRPAGLLGALPTRAATHSYRLRGYGAMIVLAPRLLPAHRAHLDAPAAGPSRDGRQGPRVLVRSEVVTPDDLDALERALASQMAAQAAALAQIEARQKAWTKAREREIRRQLELVQAEAEAVRVEVDRAREIAEAELRIRLGFPSDSKPAPVVAEAAETPAVPARPPAPRAPAPPDVPPVAPAAPSVPASLPVPPPPFIDMAPPWQVWFEFESSEEDDTGPEDVLLGVRDAIAAGLEAHRGRLESLRPEESIGVAVDFVPTTRLRARPTRTLLARVRVQDVLERRAGTLSGPEFRRRIEYEEY
jgi:hypothetical protein